MAKVAPICALLLVVLIAESFAANANCPSSSSHSLCSPKCDTDSNCKSGKICCPNVCNAKSCVDLALGSNKYSNDGYKSKTGGAAGVYCNNVKCNSYEKCELDRSTNRMRCVRA